MWKIREQERLIALSPQEEDRLKKVFEQLDKNNDSHLCVEDLRAAFKRLGHEIPKGYLEELIWEVDETQDQKINYDEFQLVYRRVRSDKTGFETRKLYNLAWFLMMDDKSDGVVDVDEAMMLMFMRHGKTFDDGEVLRMFGVQPSDGPEPVETTITKTIGFSEFEAFVERERRQRIAERAAREILPPPPPPKPQRSTATSVSAS